MKNRFIILLLLIISLKGYGQTEILQKIIIYKGKCSGENCNPSIGYDALYFERELEYCLTDSTFRKRKKLNNQYKEIKNKPSSFFTSAETYRSLDSLFQNFSNIELMLGKLVIYRVEMVYAKTKNNLPAKIKTMDFYLSIDPRRQYPKILSDLISEYNLFYNNKH